MGEIEVMASEFMLCTGWFENSVENLKGGGAH